MCLSSESCASKGLISPQAGKIRHLRTHSPRSSSHAPVGLLNMVAACSKARLPTPPPTVSPTHCNYRKLFACLVWLPVGAFMDNPSGLPIQRSRSDYQPDGWHPPRLAWEVGLSSDGGGRFAPYGSASGAPFVALRAKKQSAQASDSSDRDEC